MSSAASSPLRPTLANARSAPSSAARAKGLRPFASETVPWTLPGKLAHTREAFQTNGTVHTQLCSASPPQLRAPVTAAKHLRLPEPALHRLDWSSHAHREALFGRGEAKRHAQIVVRAALRAGKRRDMGRMVRTEDACEVFRQEILNLPAHSTADGHDQPAPFGVAPRLKRFRRMSADRWV